LVPATEVGLTLFNHFVGAGNERGRLAEPERPGGLEMNREVVFGRLLDRLVRQRQFCNSIDDADRACAIYFSF